MVRIMEKYHWDYYTFMSQPSYLIENIMRMSGIENDYLEKKNNGK